MRNASGQFHAQVLGELWDAIPPQFRTTELRALDLSPEDLAAFSTGVARETWNFTLRFSQLPEPVDREMAWVCWRIIGLGGRVPVGTFSSVIRWMAKAVAAHPELDGSVMAGTPREWERAILSAYARANGRMPGKEWIGNVTALLRRAHQLLWTAYDQRPWWKREVWNPELDPRIPLREHEPQRERAIYFHQLQPSWLRHAVQWYFKTSLETGQLTWSTIHGRRHGLQVFGDWVTGLQPSPPPCLCDDPADFRVVMLEFRAHVRALTTRAGRNHGKPLSDLRVNGILTDAEVLYAFMTDQRETAARVLDEPGWLRLGPYHAILWRHGEKGRPGARREQQEYIDDTAFSQIMANLHLLGAPAPEDGFDNEQLMRIMLLVARTGRRLSEIRMLDRDPLLPLDPITPPGGQDAAEDAFVARLRYQQTKIDDAPDTMPVDAEIVAIIREQQQWADDRLAPHWAAGVTPRYLFLARKMNRHADKPYPVERIHQVLTEFAGRLGIRDGTGRLVDFNRTHRFRHTKATSLLNAGVPLHVVQRYMGHLSPTMTMRYAQTLAATHEAEFLRYRKITSDGRDLAADPRDLYDLLELDRRADRILPNGWCLLPPRQSCDKGNACLLCDKFATDASFLPEHQAHQQRTGQLIADRQRAFQARTGQPMSTDNIWLSGRLQEQDALGRIILRIEQTRLADGTVQAVRGAGVTARTDARAAAAEEARRHAR
jgi:integrase